MLQAALVLPIACLPLRHRRTPGTGRASSQGLGVVAKCLGSVVSWSGFKFQLLLLLRLSREQLRWPPLAMPPPGPGFQEEGPTWKPVGADHVPGTWDTRVPHPNAPNTHSQSLCEPLPWVCSPGAGHVGGILCGRRRKPGCGTWGTLLSPSI